MAVGSRTCTICMVLAKEYPNGLTWEELFQKAQKDNPTRFHSILSLTSTMGVIDGERDGEDRGVVCWKEVDGKIYYDTSRKAYAPTSDSFGFATYFNNWLKGMGLSHLILFEPQTAENSKCCPYGIEWDEIPQKDHCTWSYEKEICYPSACHISGAQKRLAVLRAEGRSLEDYMRELDGD